MRRAGAEALAGRRWTLVGREAELARLGELYDLAGQGRRQIVFVTGEAGIGKTTLVEAFAGEVERQRAGLVARGQCLEQRGAPEPYLPVFDALGRLCQVDPGRWRCCPGWPRPGWPRCRRWSSRPTAPTWNSGPWAGRRGRMLREAAEALEAAGSDRPLVLVLEDLHWADPSTVDLLEWLARRDTPARLLVVGTYRPADALAGGAPIGDAGAELRLRGLANELRLGELGPQAVAAVLGRGLPGADVPEELARLVHRRTDGVPLFVVQLAQAWTDAGVLRPASGRWELAPRPPGDDPEVPDDLRRLLELQLERLDAADLAMLEAAAVGGVEFAAATAAGRRARDRRRGRGALRGARPPRPLPAAHRPGGLAGRDRVVGFPVRPRPPPDGPVRPDPGRPPGAAPRRRRRTAGTGLRAGRRRPRRRAGHPFPGRP